MATREEIQMAIDAIELLNTIGTRARNVSSNLKSEIARLNAVISDASKLALLTAGLTVLGVDAGQMNTDKNELDAIFDYILANVPVITKL